MPLKTSNFYYVNTLATLQSIWDYYVQAFSNYVTDATSDAMALRQLLSLQVPFRQPTIKVVFCQPISKHLFEMRKLKI